MLNFLRWLGLAEAALAVGLGLFGEELLCLPPAVRPVTWAVVVAGVAFAVYCWFSTRKLLIPIVTEVILTIVGANLVISTAWGPRFAAILERDTEVIYRLIPGVEKLSPNPDGDWIQWRTNSRGFRGPEIEQNSNALRVIVYGDSFVQAAFSPVEKTFTARLRDSLSNRLHRPVETINAGVNGYGPDQSLRRMRRELPELRPRLTLLVLFAGNDFGDLIRNRLYRLDEKWELKENEFALSPRLVRDIDGPRYRPVLLNAIDAAWTVSRAVRRQRNPLEQLEARQSEYADYIVNGNNEIDSIGSDTSDLDMALYPNSPAAIFKVRLMEQVLARCARAAADNDSAFALIIVGRAEDLAGDLAVHPAKYPDYHPSNLTDFLAAIAERQQIPCVNTYPAFQRAGAAEVHFLADSDFHWNAAGQRLAADLTADFLVAGDQPLLGPVLGAASETAARLALSGNRSEYPAH